MQPHFLFEVHGGRKRIINSLFLPFIGDVLFGIDTVYSRVFFLERSEASGDALYPFRATSSVAANVISTFTCLCC